MAFFDDLKDWAQEAGELIKIGTGIFSDVKNAGKTSTTTANDLTPPYNPNVIPGDYAFKPYYPLLIIGGVLLLVALVIKKA